MKNFYVRIRATLANKVTCLAFWLHHDAAARQSKREVKARIERFKAKCEARKKSWIIRRGTHLWFQP